ncbi:hypothetical protein SANTM175S_03564 [Streptomyces antimycoticus]
MTERLRGALDETGVDPSGVAGVFSLLGLDESAHGSFEVVPAGLAATVALVQGLGDAGVVAPLWCGTRGAVSVGRSDRLVSPTQAMVWGLGRIVGVEYPQRWGGVVDLPETIDSRAVARLAGVLTGAESEDQVAVRGSGVFAKRMVRASAADDAENRGSWQGRGSALVTGGTGALGGHVARWLARTGTEHLVLTSRSGMEAEGAAELKAELEGLGARVTVAACDAADREALAAVLDAIPQEFPLTAVVHTAGVLDDGVVDALTVRRAAGVLRPKVDATRNLHELTAGMDLSAMAPALPSATRSRRRRCWPPTDRDVPESEPLLLGAIKSNPWMQAAAGVSGVIKMVMMCAFQLAVGGPDGAGARTLNVYSRLEDPTMEQPWVQHATACWCRAARRTRPARPRSAARPGAGPPTPGHGGGDRADRHGSLGPPGRSARPTGPGPCWTWCGCRWRRCSVMARRETVEPDMAFKDMGFSR